jgi:hypothetical protein
MTIRGDTTLFLDGPERALMHRTIRLVCNRCGALGRAVPGSSDDDWRVTVFLDAMRREGWTESYRKIRAGSLLQNVCPSCSTTKCR